jgi:hypothetical protein
MSNANYNGKQPNNTAYIKNFVYGIPANLWKVLSYTKSDGTSESVITPSSPNFSNLYIPGDLFVDGNIVNPSDINLKQNIEAINIATTNKIMDLKPSSFTFKDDSSNNIHYGFVAQDLENEYPELIQTKPDSKYSKIKAINYLEIIPLLVNKIQLMQQEIDILKLKLETNIETKETV